MDDSVDVLKSVDEATLPAGAQLFVERGSGGGSTHYIRLTLQSGESLESALVRIDPWLRTIKLPASKTFVWQKVPVYNSASPDQLITGWRSYLIQVDPFLTSTDAVDVALVDTVQSTDVFPKDGGAEILEKKEPKWSVRVHLQPAAAERLKRVMRDPSLLRFVLLVNNRVLVAPYITGPAEEDDLTVSMGSTLNRAESFLKAQDLLQALSKAVEAVGRTLS